MTQPNIGIKLSVSGNAQVKGALSDVERSLGSVSSAARAAMGPLVGLFSAGAFVGKVAQVQREFDVLNSSLKTVTGSSAAAAREMEWLKSFAKETPFGLNQATQAFVKMKALGLDPSRAALTSYGNTASAMGKDLNQMIEAVADAATGEFERLKEFGVKSKKEGDQVSFTFQGVTTKIGNNAAEITGYLESLGNNQFAGAMAERANTLDGAIANLGKTWDELFRTISAQNAGTLMHNAVRMAEAAVTDLTTVLRALNGTTADNASQTGAAATVQQTLATAFETAAVIGAEVKYVLVQVGREIGVISAVYGQVLKFNWEGAKEIARQYHQESKTARDEVDATTARILNARQAAGLSSPNNYDEPAVLRARQAAAAQEAAAAKALADAKAKEAAAQAAANAARLAGQAEAQKAAEADLAFRRKYTLELIKGMEDAAQAELAYQAALDARNFDAAWEADQKNLAAVDARIKAGRTTLEQLQFENSLLALNTTEREVAIAMRELERQGVVQGTEAYKAYAAAIQTAVVNREAQREARDFWSSIETTAKDVFTDVADGGVNAFQRIGKTIKASVLDVLWQMTGRQWLISVGAAMGVPGAAMASTASGGNSLLGTLGNLSGAYNSLGTIGSLASSAAVASGATYGTGFLSQQSAMLAAQEAGFTAAATSAASTVASAVPYVAAVLAVASIANATKGESRWGGQYGYNFGGGLVNNRRGTEVVGAVLGVNRLEGVNTFAEAEVQAAISGTVGSINALLASAGSSATLAGFQAGLETSGKGRGGVFAGGTLSTGATFGESGQGNNYAGTLFEKTSTQSPDAQTALANFALDLQQATIQALQAATDIPESLKKLVQGADAEALTADAAAALLGSVQGQISAVKQLQEAFDSLGWQSLIDITHDATVAMAETVGGFDALAQSLSGYYQNFYSDQERLSTLQAQVSQQLTTLGINDLPDTVAAYRQLVDDAMADGNETLAASLIKLSGAFFEVETAATAATNALLDRLQAESATLADFTRSKSRLLLGLDVPGFASGGVHSGGLRIVGENGPELEATGPARYWTASQTASLVNGQSTPATEPVVAELRALRAEVSDLRAETRATASHTAKTARLLDRAMPDGQSIQTTVAA